MPTLDDMSAHDLIALYYEKHHAIQSGDMTKLIALKNKNPDIFDKEKDAQIRDMIEYIKEFQNSDRYKELFRLDMKEKLSIINNDSAEE